MLNSTSGDSFMIINNNNLQKAPGILGILFRGFKNYPDKPVITVENNTLDYKTMIEKGNRVASALYDIGIRKNDKIGVICENCIEFYIFLFAVVRLGAVFVPFDPQIGKFEIKYLFERVGIRAVLVSQEYRGLSHKDIINELKPELHDLRKIIVNGECEENFFTTSLQTLFNHNLNELPEIELTPEDSNMFMCTTGSTGNPKIVDIQCKMINYSLERNADYFSLFNNDRFLLTMPLYHAGGFGWGLSCLSAGGSLYYLKAFKPTKVLECIQNNKITKFLSTPTLLKILSDSKKVEDYDTSSLKKIYSTGEYLSDEVVNLVKEKFKVIIVNGLGMSETNVFLLWDSENDGNFPTNHFHKIPGVDIKIVDGNDNVVVKGEKGFVCIKSSVMRGYFRAPDITEKVISKDGWLNSGDLAYETEEGRIVFCGRGKRVIKRGGNLVSPEEIEKFLVTHPSVEIAVADKEEDELIGEKIIAYIQPKENKSVSEEELRLFCKGNISSYKIPDEFYFVKEIPKTMGKLNPTVLKKLKAENKIEFI